MKNQPSIMTRNHAFIKVISSPSTIALLCITTIIGPAQNAPAADASTNAPAAAVTNAPPPKHWEGVFSADATLARGNSRSFMGTVAVNAKGKYEPNEFLLSGAAGYGDSTTKDPVTGQDVTNKSQDYLKGSAQWNYLFTDRFYAGLKLDAFHDDLADINYRFTVSPLAGYYLIKKPETDFAVEAGPSYVYEQVGGKTDSYFAVRLAERFEYRFKTGAKIWESVEWIAQVDRFGNWIANAELGISAPISKALDVRLVAQDNYDNEPAPGRVKNDFKLLAGIGYKF
jgi:hypothetical protein